MFSHNHDIFILFKASRQGHLSGKTCHVGCATVRTLEVSAVTSEVAATISEA